jgi:hypothetical protein
LYANQIEYWAGNGDGTFDLVETIGNKGYAHRFSMPPLPGAAIPYPQTWAANECPVCSTTEFSAYGGDPVNTYSGNFNYQESDFSIPVLGPPLEFVRSYNSQATGVYTSPLGAGWTHNYNIHLVISSVVTAPITMVAPHGSQMVFNTVVSGTEPQYFPRPGVRGELVRTGSLPYTYVLTAPNQYVYTFNGDGQLIEQSDSLGHSLVFVVTPESWTQKRPT